jgi:hypothetical protein
MAVGALLKEKIELPSNLEQVILKQSDQLLADGAILYGPSTPESFDHNGFQVSL